MAKEFITVGKKKRIIAISIAGALAVTGVGAGFGINALVNKKDAPPSSFEWMVDGVIFSNPDSSPAEGGSFINGGSVTPSTFDQQFNTATFDFSNLRNGDSFQFAVNLNNPTDEDYIYNLGISGVSFANFEVTVADETGRTIGIIGDKTPFILVEDQDLDKIIVTTRCISSEPISGAITFDTDFYTSDSAVTEEFVIETQSQLEQALRLTSSYPITVNMKAGEYTLPNDYVAKNNITFKSYENATVAINSNIVVAKGATVGIEGITVNGNVHLTAEETQIGLDKSITELNLKNATIQGVSEEITLNEKTNYMPAVYVADQVVAKIKSSGNVIINSPIGAAGIGISETATAEIFGEGKNAVGSLKVIANGGADENAKNIGACAIGSVYYGDSAISSLPTGKIYIHDVNNLTALGFGYSGIGIGGGVGANSIDIKDTTITEVAGGWANTEFQLDWGKGDNVGGPAIGFGYNNSVHQTVNLENVTIRKAVGGGKAAGIGGICHEGGIVNIKNCNLDRIYGGSSSAGIGSGRVGKTDDSYTYINIENSIVKATGGLYGAGIGSGYCTYCRRPDRVDGGALTASLAEIYISGNSTITAVGGDRSAAIGGGYHSPNVKGAIASTVVLLDCKAGVAYTNKDGTLKETYTIPQVVGLSALDAGRDGSLILDGLAVINADKSGFMNADADTIQTKINTYNTNKGYEEGEEGYIKYDPTAEYFVKSLIDNQGQIRNS